MLFSPFWIGILACVRESDPPFNDAAFYSLLIRHAERLGMAAAVFTPDSLSDDSSYIEGYIVGSDGKSWRRQCLPLPDLVYDRFFSADSAQLTGYRSVLDRLGQKKKPLILGNRLMGKWGVYRSLASERRLRPHLPETVRWRTPADLLRWLDDKGKIIAKPDRGTQGKGIVVIHRLPSGGYEAAGRNNSNRSFNRSLPTDKALISWMQTFLDRSYLLQSHLDLECSSGEVFDIRSLMQKNGKGVWTETGMAVRKGSAGSVTSNLHGGGSAEPVATFLEQEFGEDRSSNLMNSLKTLSMLIARILENHFGRLAELGIDFGVDRQGKLWIIEVNSKPGRAVFLSTKDKRARWLSLNNPMAYARYLLDRKEGWRGSGTSAWSPPSPLIKFS